MSRIDSLIAAMTLTEKLGQMTMMAADSATTGTAMTTDLDAGIRSGAIGNLLNLYGVEKTRAAQRLALESTRLKIPLLLGLDIIHGHRTLFPIPLGETAAFDPALWEATAREAAREGAADGLHLTFAPMLDVARDPRWGRSAEGSGEDPYVTQMMAQAKVKGFQGAGLDRPDTLAGCAKHYCAYGAALAGRDYASTDVPPRALREIYLPPFETAIAAGIATIMPAFSAIDGVPLTAHRALLKDYLRDRLGFEGVIISDYTAIAELICHGVATNIVEAAALALKAGVDIDMMAYAYRDGLPVALDQGLITMAEIDASVRRVLVLKEQLGLFEDPFRRGGSESATVLTARRQLAREAAIRSVVLLKNDNTALPLGEGRLAVIGPLADSAIDMRGCWPAAGKPGDCVSVLAGLRFALPHRSISYASGVSIGGPDESGIAGAAALCDGADTILLCLGEAAEMSGEAASRAHPGLPGRQDALVEAVLARAQGKKIIVVLFSGRPLVVPDLIARVDAVMAAWSPGCEAGNALADLLTGRASPSGRTPMSWPRAVGQIPVFFGQRPSGRPENPNDHFTSKYLDEANEPLFPFGHGLSYGDFAYTDLKVMPDTATARDSFSISVTVTNRGAHAARETGFLFIRDTVARISRPVLELKGFNSLTLDAGQSGTLQFILPAQATTYPGPDLEPLYEAGDIEIFVGPSADRSRLLCATVRLT